MSIKRLLGLDKLTTQLAVDQTSELAQELLDEMKGINVEHPLTFSDERIAQATHVFERLREDEIQSSETRH
jgi:hypothetical protein